MRTSGLFGSGALILGGLSLTIPAHAGPMCELTRSPFLMESALPDDLRCTFDQDGNGLDDAIERQLAKCVAPQFRFDSREPLQINGSEGLRADEPNTLFTVAATAPQTIQVTYTALMEYDTGFVVDADLQCHVENTHHGDMLAVRVDVNVWEDAHGWRAAPVTISGGDLRDPSSEDERLVHDFEVLGAHPVVYLSAGKHHNYAHAGTVCSDIDVGTCCDDGVDGLGISAIPGFTRGTLTHVPAQTGLQHYWQIEQSVPLNLCKLVTEGIIAPAQGFRSADLDDLGYPGQSLFTEFYDAGDYIWKKLANSAGADTGAPRDPDGDGVYNIITADEDPTTGKLAFLMPLDRCGWDPNLAATDEDGDGLYGRCDPEPAYRNTYVAGGSPAWPSASMSTLDGWVTSDGAGHGRGGFLDSDRDGYVDGEDLCPADPLSGLDNSNGNAELRIFQSATFEALRDFGLGTFYRGNACDPYPATGTRWRDSGEERRSGTCDLRQTTEGGADVVRFDAAVSAGRSMNDPHRAEADTRQFRVGTYRCACTTPGCLDSFVDDCSRDRVRRSIEEGLVGRGWRPAERRDCTRGTDGYCADDLLLAPYQQKLVSWHWRDEALSHPEHFAAGDIWEGGAPPSSEWDSPPEMGLVYPYALGTLAIIDNPPGLDLPQNSDFPEPEQTPWGTKLLDVNSDESHWMRSSVAEPRTIVSPYSYFHGLSDCHFQSPFDPCARATCNFRPWDPEIYYRPWDELGRGPFQGITIFWPGPSLITDGFLARPELGAVQRVALAEPGHWASSVPGTGLMTPSYASLSAATTPSILWVERGAEARWAIFAPAFRSQGAGERSLGEELAYAPIAEGETGFAVSPSAKLLRSNDGLWTVLYDAETQRLARFELGSSDWTDLDAPAEIFDRSGPALAVLGSQLAIVGGISGANQLGDSLVDLRTGEAQPWDFGVPARVGAQLGPSPEAGKLVLRGGQAPDGTWHDDIWEIAVRTHQAALRLADHAAGAGFDTRAAAVLTPAGAYAFIIGSGGGLEQIALGTDEAAEACVPAGLIGYAVYGVGGAELGAHAAVTAGSIGAGGGLVALGAHSRASGVATNSDVALGAHAEVSGSILAGGAVALGAHAHVDGITDANLRDSLPGLGCGARVDSGSGGGAVVVAPHSTRALPPGDYGPLLVQAHATVELSAGDYHFDAVIVQAHGVIRLQSSAGNIRIHTRSALLVDGDVVAPDAARLLWRHFGDTAIRFKNGVQGTIFAPAAPLTLGGTSEGAAFARHVLLGPHATIARKAWIGGW